MTTDRIFEVAVLAVTLSSFWLVFVLSVRIAVTRWLGARWAYYLWLVPLVGLLAMGIPGKPVQRVLDVPGIEVPFVNRVIEAAGGLLSLTDRSGQVRSAQISGNSQVTLPQLLLITWGLGAFLFLLYFGVRSFQFVTKIRHSSQTLTQQQESLVRTRCAGLANRSNTAIRMLSAGGGPEVAGLLQPMLLLPVDFFQRYNKQQQILILEHEYQHLRRHDLIFLLVARVYRCLFWFNPLVHVAERYLQLDQELSCDEMVLATKNRATRRIYGETLILSASRRFIYPQVSYAPSFGQIKQRTNMLRHYNRRIFGGLLGSLLLLISVTASVSYGVFGAPEFESDLEIREALRLPMAESLKLLESGDFDDQSLRAMLARLKNLETAFPEQALNNHELAQLDNLKAFVYYQLGDYERSLAMYEQVASLSEDVPEQQFQALNSIAEIQFVQGNYVETIKALVKWQDSSTLETSLESLALRSQAFVRLKNWDQGLHFIDLAIAQAEADGRVPREQWLLSQTALKWKLGDLAGAARSLQKSIEFFPDTSYQRTLAAFNESVQEVWQPLLTEKTPVQL